MRIIQQVAISSKGGHKHDSDLWVGHYDNRLKLGNSFGYNCILFLSWLGIVSPQIAAIGPSHPTVGMGFKLTCSQ